MTRLRELNTELNRLAPGMMSRPTDTQTLIDEGRIARAEVLSGLTRRAVQAIGHGAQSIGLDRIKDLIANTSLVRSWRCRRTIAELSGLSDWMLADIGLSRSQIVEVAMHLSAQAESAKPVSKPATKPAQTTFYARLREAQERRSTIRELEQLPDRILADIGLTRGQIPGAVEDLMAQRKVSIEAKSVGGSPSPVHGLLSHLEGAVRPLRQWQLSRLAAGQIARLGSATLADLGYVKGDVDWVPEVLASRKIANSTHPQTRPHAGIA